MRQPVEITIGEEAGNAICPSCLPVDVDAVNDLYPPAGTLARLAMELGDSGAVAAWPLLLGAFRATVSERVERNSGDPRQERQRS